MFGEELNQLSLNYPNIAEFLARLGVLININKDLKQAKLIKCDLDGDTE